MSEDGGGFDGAGAMAARRSGFTPALGEAICARVAGGESLAAVGRDAAMPALTTIKDWARREAEFGAALRRAQDAARRAARDWDRMAPLRRAAVDAGFGRRRPRFKRASTFSDGLAERICALAAAGETTAEICARRGMPAVSTLYAWLRERPDFANAWGLAKEAWADAMFDRAWGIALAATPATVAVARLQIDVIKWQAAKLAPRKYADRLEIKEGPRVLNVIIDQFPHLDPPLGAGRAGG
jgi:hypothetical protein